MPRIRLLLPALTLLAVLALPPAAPAASVTVTTDADAWTNSAARNQNYGSTTIMRARGTAKRPFIRFTVPALDGPVEKAVLRFEAKMGAPRGLRVYSTSAAWTEETLTHANAPPLGALVATEPGFSSPGWREVDVTSAVTGPGAHSFAVTAPNATGDIFLTSRQGGRAPELVVTTSGTTMEPPGNTAPPTVSGTARQGQTLTATTGTWSGTAPLSYAYQWLRCDVAGVNCAAVSGAGGSSFVLTALDVGKTMRVRVTAENAAGRESADSFQTDVVYAEPGDTEPGTVITTSQAWFCRGALSAFGELPIKVVSDMPNPGDHNAINLVGCYGDGDPATVDLVLDVRGNGSDRGTAYDAVRIGQNARDLVVTGNVECGARHTNPAIHQDVVQALSGNRIEFRDFTTGDPETGRWTCWGAGGGWFINWANGNIPTDVVCVRCKLATYNQNMRIHESVRSGARDSVFGYSRSYGIVIGPEAVDPVNVGNRVIRY